MIEQLADAANINTHAIRRITELTRRTELVTRTAGGLIDGIPVQAGAGQGRFTLIHLCGPN